METNTQIPTNTHTAKVPEDQNTIDPIVLLGGILHSMLKPCDMSRSAMGFCGGCH